MKCRFCLVLAVCLAGILSDARAGCGPGGCQPTAILTASEEWRPHNEDSAYFGHYRSGIQVGGYNAKTGIYRPYDAATRKWGQPQRMAGKEFCACVFGCECEDNCECAGGKRCKDDCTCVARKEAAIPNYGVDLSRLNGKEHEVVTLNGQPIAKQQLLDLLAGAELKDDSSKLRLTVIGPDDSRKQVMDDLARPPLSEFRDNLLVQAYPPTHWAVARAGFVTTGKPTIYVQAPDGKVLHRQDDYEGGAPQLAEAIRRIDPNYDPKKDLDLRKLLRVPNPLSKVPVAAWLLAAGLLYGLIAKGRP